MSKASRRRRNRKKKAIQNKYKAELKSKDELIKELEQKEKENLEPKPPVERKDGKPKKSLSRDRKNWTQEEIDKLMDGIAEGKSNQEIAYELHKRTQAIVRKRKQLVGDMLKETKNPMDEVGEQKFNIPIEDPENKGETKYKSGYWLSEEQAMHIRDNWVELMDIHVSHWEYAERMLEEICTRTLEHAATKKAVYEWCISSIAPVVMSGCNPDIIDQLLSKMKQAEKSVSQKEIDEMKSDIMGESRKYAGMTIEEWKEFIDKQRNEEHWVKNKLADL